MSAREPGPRTRAFVSWTLRRGRLLWVIAALLTIPATWRTASLYLHLRSEIDELLPRDAPSVLAIQELRQRMPGLQYLGIIVDAGDASRLPAAERMLDDLAARVKAYPPELVRAARTGVGEERAFVTDHAAIFMDLDDLRTIHKRIEARRDYEVQKSLDLALDSDEKPPSIDFSDIEAKYKDKDPTRGRFPNNRFTNPEQNTSLLLIEVGGFSTGADRGKKLMDRVKADIADLGGPDRYAPGMRVGYTGDVAISVEEMTGLIADLSLSSVLVLFAVAAVILLYYQWSRSIIVLLLPLIVGAVYAFGLVSLPPFNITELNSNTAFMGSIIVGNGVNTSIILLARYVEERRGGAAVEESLTRAIWGTRTATFSAALAASVAYGSLIVTQFRGFRQFGAIGGIGLLACWGTSYLLLPPLAAWLDSGHIPPARRSGTLMNPLSRVVTRYATPVAVVSLLCTALSVYSVRHFNLGQLEHDFSHLRRASTWVSGEGFWGRKMDALLGRYLSPTVILADNAEQARAIAEDVRKEAREGPLADRVANVRIIEDVLPADQGAKLEELSAIKKMLTPRLLSYVPKERREDVDRLLGDAARKPITPADLPATLTTGLRERDGHYDRVVLVYPRPSSKALWQGPPLMAYVDSLRAIAARHPADGRPARVAGSHPLTADIIRAVERDGPIAALTAFAGVVAVVVVMFRGRSTTVFVLGSLLTGIAWFVAATLSIGVRVNFTNFIALPISLGIGVDYAVNVMSRYEEDGQHDIGAAVRATGGAVGLCSLTTIIGYSSLLIADNRALFSFGVAAVLGEVGCLTAAIVALPSVLVLLRRRR